MSFPLIHGQNFTRTILSSSPLQKGEYEQCTFDNGNFPEHDFSGFRFINCVFINCNLSMILLNKTAFQDCIFRNCKMLGLRFDHCSGLGLSFRFENCQLNHSSFYKCNIKKTHFENCQLLEVDFSQSDISNSIFDSCDLQRATFDKSNLEKSDFRKVYNFQIDPDQNRIKKAKFSMNGALGLLAKYDIIIE